MKTIEINLEYHNYNIYLDHDLLKDINKYYNLNRKVMIITDSNVPLDYINTVKNQCKTCYITTVNPGEESKSLDTYKYILEELLKYNFSRKDLIIAIGGGVIGDLSGFVASSYMRGIDYISCPTTTLSQIDSSIGGKVAINLDKVKNIVGAFYHPQAVFIDFDTTKTLTRRHYNNGLVEALKAGYIKDKSIIDLFLKNDLKSNAEEIIYKSLLVKKEVVEKDEKEQNLRKILNFGHTIGHAIESLYGLKDLYHGECVGLGMLAVTKDSSLKAQMFDILNDLKIPTHVEYDKNKALELMKKDKKANDTTISLIEVKEVGNAEIIQVNFEYLEKLMKGE